MATESPEAERVVLLDEAGNPQGSAAKASVHHADTPLHLAFSCYVFDGSGRVLMTRRALAKRTWPGVWTNSCCGHPAPGEDPQAAVIRRIEQELRLSVSELTVELPDFRYRATDASGVVENEICPVYSCRTSGDPDPEPSEVAEWAWAPWPSVVDLARQTPWALSPWAAVQIPQLSPRRG